MGRSLDIKISLDPGGVIFHRRFTRFVSDLTDLSPAFEEMADAFGEWEQQVFATRGGSAGAPWKPRKAPTGGWPLLVRTGALRASLTGPSVRQITPRRMVLGTNDPKAGFHQTGTRKMVARPLVRLTAANKAQWTRIIHAYLLKSATGRLAGA